MLQNISEEIRQCYHNAADCVRKAEIVQDESLHAYYLRSERGRLKLAQSYALGQRLTLFVDEHRKGIGDADRNIRRVGADSSAIGTARVKPPESGEVGVDNWHYLDDFRTASLSAADGF